MRILLLLLFLSSNLLAQNQSPKELDIYVKEFKELFPLTLDVFIQLEDNSSLLVLDPYTGKIRDPHGYCDRMSKGMYINGLWWTNERSIYRKKKVLFHELSHCLLGLDHPKDLHEFTIMNSILQTASENGDNWSYLVRELRGRSIYSHQ